MPGRDLGNQPLTRQPQEAVGENFLRLTSAEEAKLILQGLGLIQGNKTVVLHDLIKRATAAERYFKSLSNTTIIKTAADKRNLQRRRDGRG